MLVLQRSVGERLALTLPDGSTIYVMLVDVCSQNSAKIGIEAPANVAILRDDAVVREKKIRG